MELIFNTQFSKRPCIYKRVGSTIYPIMYFQKAKHVSDDEFNKIVRFIIDKANKQ